VPKEDSVKLKKTTLAHIFKEWVYSIQHTDWLCETTEQPLTGYIPTAKLAAQLEYFINKNSE
jgi:seryl-tRNA synthetase